MELEIHWSTAQNEQLAGRATERNGIRRLTIESNPVEQCYGFAFFRPGLRTEKKCRNCPISQLKNRQ